MDADLRGGRIHRWVVIALRLLLFAGMVLGLAQGQWLLALTIAGILTLTLLPVAIDRRFGVKIPSEFEALAVVFVFASLFLGEIREFYVRFWWWDILLHTGSGLITGIFGFLLVYVLNRHERIAMHLEPGFTALFAFTFAVALGSLWEIFEFAVDMGFGANMQKSGLVDTMGDLIVNAFGAAAISAFGYVYLKTDAPDSFLEVWIIKFIKANPGLFRS